MKLPFLSLLFLICTTLQAQELDWLKNSTSENSFSTHRFYASTYHDGHFYFAGDFWKDLTIDNFHIEITDDIHDGFIIKMDESGTASQLWHFASDDYIRINKVVVNPVSESLIVVGQFRTNLIYNGDEWNTPFFIDGFVMSLQLNGTLNWMKEVDSDNEFSFASGEALGIDDQGNIFVAFEAGGMVSMEKSIF